jgi:hypothetical protein
MSIKNDGGPAFPMPEKNDQDGGISGTSHPGMSLRVWLAAHAPHMTDQWWDDSERDNATWLQARVAWNYAYADAMLAESEKEDQ